MKIELEPSHSRLVYPGGRNATACISVDYDHISNVGSDTSNFTPGADSSKLKLNRAGTRMLLDISARYSIPMTWAICGKTAEADTASYSKILNSEVESEIAVHTYSHLDVSSCAESELQDDLAKWKATVKVNQTPTTFIFPWNRTGHFDFLGREGFRTYRGKERIIGTPKLNGGFWNIPPVFYVDTKSQGALGNVRKFVDLCIKNNAVFHVWMHPWSVVYPEEPDLLQRDILSPMFEYLDAKRKEGLLSICTLGELSSAMQTRPTKSELNYAVSNV
jgi:peptidoglycan/xylan/chitin deacetylase (PgdA/CDA1 family)